MIRRQKKITRKWYFRELHPLKTNLTLYCGSYVDTLTAPLAKPGKHKTGMGCVYINKLADIDLKVLKGMIEAGCKLK